MIISKRIYTILFLILFINVNLNAYEKYIINKNTYKLKERIHAETKIIFNNNISTNIKTNKSDIINNDIRNDFLIMYKDDINKIIYGIQKIDIIDSHLKNKSLNEIYKTFNYQAKKDDLIIDFENKKEIDINEDEKKDYNRVKINYFLDTYEIENYIQQINSKNNKIGINVKKTIFEKEKNTINIFFQLEEEEEKINEQISIINNFEKIYFKIDNYFENNKMQTSFNISYDFDKLGKIDYSLVNNDNFFKYELNINKNNRLILAYQNNNNKLETKIMYMF